MDTEAPTILSIEDVTIPLGTNYIQAEIDFSDNYDENSVLEVEGTVNINEVGSYPITFTVTDSSDNVSTFVHYVHVVDEIAPTISLLGDASLVVYRGRDYTEAGYEVSDNYDTELVVTVSGIVDTDTDGTYTLVYIVSDSSGNQSSTERVITVKRKPSSSGGSSSSSSTPPPAPDPIAISNTASGLNDTEITINANRAYTEIIYVSGILDYENEHSGLWETISATSSFTVSGLMETGYEFAVKDSTGQVSPIYSVVIDSTLPVVETTYYTSTGTTDTIPGHDRYANSVDYNDGVLTAGAPDALSGELVKIFREGEQGQVILSYSATEIGFGSDAVVEGEYLLVGAPDAKGPNNEEIGEVSIYDADSGIKERTFSYSLFFNSGVNEHYMYVEGDGISVPNTFRLIDITYGSTYPTLTDPITANDLVLGIHNTAIAALAPIDGHLGENLDADGDYFVASSYTDSGLGFVYLGSFSDSGFRRI